MGVGAWNRVEHVLLDLRIVLEFAVFLLTAVSLDSCRE